MTNEEAIKWCRDFQDNIVDVTDKLEDKHTMALKAVNKAIEALAKQIPKKSNLNGHHYECPNGCGVWLLFDDEVPNKNDCYCPRCGQRIDWSDSND